jgi:hypothetical protein
MIRGVIGRADFDIDWEPSTELLGRGVGLPLLGPELHTLLGRKRPANPAILLVPARDLAIRDLVDLGYGPSDLVSVAYVADAAEAAGIARGLLLAGDVATVTETMVLVGPDKADAEGWRADRVGPFLGQARAYAITIDRSRPLLTTNDPAGWAPSFLDLSGIVVERDAWACRDLVGEDLARWRGREADGVGSDGFREIAGRAARRLAY